MHLSSHEWWGLIHGMVLGALFLLAFAGGLADLYSLRPALVTTAGITERIRRSSTRTGRKGRLLRLSWRAAWVV